MGAPVQCLPLVQLLPRSSGAGCRAAGKCGTRAIPPPRISTMRLKRKFHCLQVSPSRQHTKSSLSEYKVPLLIARWRAYGASAQDDRTHRVCRLPMSRFGARGMRWRGSTKGILHRRIDVPPTRVGSGCVGSFWKGGSQRATQVPEGRLVPQMRRSSTTPKPPPFPESLCRAWKACPGTVTVKHILPRHRREDHLRVRHYSSSHSMCPGTGPANWRTRLIPRLR
jgi:hypothetical protein